MTLLRIGLSLLETSVFLNTSY